MALWPRITDEELINRIVNNNDKDAANELISTYYRCVYKEIYLKVLDEELSMDLTQETFIAVLRGLKTFDEKKAKFKTWIIKIAGNKVTDYFRSRQHHEKIMTEIMGDDIAETRADGTDVELEIIDNLSTEELEKMYGHHGGTEWKIFKMKVYEGYTFVQIAEKLGMETSTVKRKYYSMCRRIREEWDYLEKN